MCEIIDVEIWAFDANKNIPDKISPGIDFTAEEVIQYDVPVVTIFL